MSQRLQGVAVGIVIGAAFFGLSLSAYTGLRIDKVFEFGESLNESNQQSVAEYAASEKNAATTLMVLENRGAGAARERLWGLSRRLYWDTVKQRPQSELEKDFGARFVEFVRASNPLMEFVHAEDVYGDGDQ